MNILKVLSQAILWGVTTMAAVTVMAAYHSVWIGIVVVLTGVCMVATVALLFGDLPIDRRTNGR